MRPQVLYLLSYLVLTSHASTVVKNATVSEAEMLCAAASLLHIQHKGKRLTDHLS